MCTLSWQIRNNRLTVVFNRDERFSRPDAHPPGEETIDGIRVLAPRDPEGGGTWIAANENGLVTCLMNYYHAPFRVQPGVHYRSRGLLVRQVSACTDLHTLRKMLGNMDLHSCKPFHLIVFPGVFAPIEWQWDGSGLKEIIGPPHALSSTGLFPRLIIKLRTRLFRKATSNYLNELTDEQQLELHRSRRPWPPAISVAMRMKNRGTVSLTQVKVTPAEVVMSYLPGDPATTRQPMESVKMGRNGALKPARKLIPCEPYPKDPVDVVRLLGEKNPAMHRKLSWPAKAGIRLVARESVINNRLNHAHDLTCNLFPAKVLSHTGVRGHLRPAAGPLPDPAIRPVFLSNHPTGGLDGILLLHWLSTYYPDIRLIVNDLLWNLHHMRPFIVPVDVFGDSRKALKTLVEVFEGDAPLMVFPSGETARKKNGVLTEAPWQKNPVKMALKFDRTVVPIRLDGYNSRLFYAVARARTMLRIPLNLEMMLLSHEFFFPKWKDFGVTVGEPLGPEKIRNLGRTDEERAKALRMICVQQSPPLPSADQ
jgi:1-acyl-sn-glycerol-3-phosphate acyltransferase